MPSGAGIDPRNPDQVNIDPADTYSVTELSQNIKQVLSAAPQLNDLLIQGEISSFTRAASEHIYFNLKDENSVIACAFFKHLQAEGCDYLGDGLQIIAMGSVMAYEPRSRYQLNIKKIIPIGDGVSSLKLKRLRDKLGEEGLFSQDRKKPIPRLPRKVGVITSKDSAAIKDILTVVNARFPKMDLVMAFATLQGDGAPRNIIQALSTLGKITDIDTIILARGGGSSEDFTAFNDEKLVRVIASSTKSVITGIGHERDTCLADLAADFRASTPSTAVKAAIPDIQELINGLNDLRMRLLSSCSLSLELERKDYENLRNGLNSLRMNLDRSYESYLKGLKIREKEVEIAKKDEEIKQALVGDRSDLLKYKAAIVVLIVFLVLVILIFLLRG